MNAVPLPLENIAEEARSFRDGFRTLHLATCSASGVPTASYAPFAPSARESFFIYVSELAAHTPNLRAGRAPSVLFIESEQDATHLFARRRLTYSCDVRHLPRNGPGFVEAMDALSARFGEFMHYLRSLTDFHAFELVPRHGAYVRGFAQAYEFPDARFEAIRHINDQGHRNAKD